VRIALMLVGVFALLLGGAWLWLRDSSLVAVEHVAVTGESGPDAAPIRAALMRAARSMTTLDVRTDRLNVAVAPFPVVRALRVSTEFPHGMRIRVIEQTPVGVIAAAGRTVAVAGDGTLIHDLPADASLPVIPLQVPPAGRALSDPAGRAAVAVLAAAPELLLARISQVTTVAGHGLVAQVRDGPSIFFGEGVDLQAKWAAAIEVLADQGSAGAAYIDVTDPQRPAAGAGSGQPASAAGTSGAPASGGTESGSAGTGGTETAGGASAGLASGASVGGTSPATPGG
jgi:cell division protein FtsQ